MLPYLVAGLTTGSIFALAAVGLVLTYKTSGIFNFSHGALASASAFGFYFLHEQHDVPWALAAAICVFVGGPLLGLLLELVARRLDGAPLASKVLATVGLLLVIQGAVELLYKPGEPREVRQFLPTGSFHVGDTAVAANQVITFAVGLGAVVALTIFLRTSRTGLAMRAVVDNSELLDITGVPPVRVRRLAWMLGSVMACAAGVLLAPLLPLDATTMTFLVVTAFGAAAIGGFTNLPATYLGGLAIGVGQALLQKQFVGSTGLGAGLASSLPFLVLFTLLVAVPRLKNPSATLSRSGVARATWRPIWQVRAGFSLAALVVLLFVPSFAGLRLTDWTHFLAYVVLFLSLGLLVRTSGQVSLAHVTFMAIGVVAFAHVAVDHDWPWLLALAFAAAVAAPIGAVLAIPAIRFPGLYLALATLGFGILLQQMFYNQSYMFGSLGVGVTVPRPHFWGIDATGDRGYYYFVLVFAVLVALLVFLIGRSRLGRLLRAMSDSASGLASSGASINVSRVLVFCLSAVLAAIAGVLDAGTLGLVGADGYQPLLSLQLFAVVLLALGTAPWYAIIAAAAQVLLPSYISVGEKVTYALTLAFGLGAIVIATFPISVASLPAPVRRLFDLLGQKPDEHVPALGTTGAAAAGDGPEPETAPAIVRSGGGGSLRVDDVTVRFGGLVAADAVSLTADAGRITGLIGPNGAGKSTVFNVCSGYVRPVNGSVNLDDRPIGRLAVPARARAGLGRTFQQTELFDSLTVWENIAMGAEAAFAGWNPFDHILSSRSQRARVLAATNESLELCGLGRLAGADVGTLTTGQRRLVELARCLAGHYEVIMLDEPSSGLDHIETERFGEILRRVTTDRGVAILLVEHDMALVNQVCDYVYVVDFGKSIFNGTVSEVSMSAAVRQAYLGDALPPVEREIEDATA